MSPAYQLVEIVFKHGREAARTNRDDYRSAMTRTLDTAIRAGLRFDVDDFARMAKDLHLGYWGNAEAAYAAACKIRNISACKSYEKWMGRKPFILAGNRLFVGANFDWKGIRRYACVTAFMPDGESLSACAYEPRCEATKALAAIAKKSFGRRKVERRIKITHAEVQEASRLLNKNKQAAKAKQEIADIMARCEDLSIYVPEEDAADLTKDERSQALRWLHYDYWRRIPMPAGLSRVKGQ